LFCQLQLDEAPLSGTLAVLLRHLSFLFLIYMTATNCPLVPPVRTKPNISTLAAESSIMFVNNKTAEWLNSKTEQEREAFILWQQV
jgi:hypothetical protein